VRFIRPHGKPDPAILQTWLEHLAKASPHLRAAEVVDVPDGAASPVRSAAWPAGAGADDPTVLSLARRVVEAQRYVGVVPRGAPDVRLLAVPLVTAGLPRAAVVAHFAASQESPRRDLEALVHAVTLLRRLLEVEAQSEETPRPTAPGDPGRAVVARPPPKQRDDGSRETLDLLVAALEHRELAAAAAAVVNRLAASLRANRVCLGMWNGKSVELLAVSGSAVFDAATGLSTAVRDAMQEALSQRATLAVPVEGGAATREDAAQRVLLRLSGGGAVCTVPFPDGASLVGAVTLEWAEAEAVDAALRARCEAMLALVGPVLSALQRAEFGLLRRGREAVAASLKGALGPRRPVLKLALVTGIALLAVGSSVSAVHRVAGNAVLRGSVQRHVLAPADGFIATASARPGEVVAEGAVLATLDDQALSLEVAKWQAEYDETLNQYREALSLLDSSKVTTLRASLERALAELELAEDTLGRSAIRAPIAGVVVSGDLSQSLGAPVQRGTTLFEVAALDSYHVSVRVSEDEVGLLAPGQPGRLTLQALPGESLEIVVERVTPVSEVVDGSNVFEVEARLLDAREVLRPGMQGAAKFDVGRARLAWLWTHRIVDWLLLKLWVLGLWG
jgi:RND family efflux transporter MFP subunit